MSDLQPDRATIDPVKAALRGRCPRCAEGRLYAGVLKLDKSCENCGLDYAPLDQADGPAFFVMLIVGLLVTGLALYVEVVYSPRFWVHILLWVPFCLVTTFPLLRLAKSLLIGLQYRHKAAEGRLSSDDIAN